MITQAQLKKLLRYNQKTGDFFWRVDAAQSVRAGTRAGHLNSYGHRRIVISGKQYFASRLAWLYVYGYFPKGQLDHKNRNRSDDKISNLRRATHSQNMANKIAFGCSGYKGVTKEKDVWRARIQKNKSSVHLGCFNTPEAAHAAYCRAARQLHGEFFYLENGGPVLL
jgi:hypothetical protein